MCLTAWVTLTYDVILTPLHVSLLSHLFHSLAIIVTLIVSIIAFISFAIISSLHSLHSSTNTSLNLNCFVCLVSCFPSTLAILNVF